MLARDAGVQGNAPVHNRYVLYVHRRLLHLAGASRGRARGPASRRNAVAAHAAGWGLWARLRVRGVRLGGAVDKDGGERTAGRVFFRSSSGRSFHVVRKDVRVHRTRLGAPASDTSPVDITPNLRLVLNREVLLVLL